MGFGKPLFISTLALHQSCLTQGLKMQYLHRHFDLFVIGHLICMHSALAIEMCHAVFA